MSGFEIAGVVLGSLPIIISALQAYNEGVDTIQRWRRYARELKSLVRDLETEHVKLQNVCEKLLVSLVPMTRMEEMIDDPFGESWREEELYSQIRLRLWSSHKVFEDTVLDMRDAMEEMKEKLKIGKDGKVRTNVVSFESHCP